MKTIQKILTILLIMLAAAVFLPCAAFADAIGKFTAIDGDVDVLKPGMERAAPAALQQPVSEGDIVRTKSNAKAEITFTDDSVIRLAPGSRLQITEYLMEGSKRKSGVMNLFRGKVRAVVSKSRGFLSVAFGAGDRFEVRTPTAVAGVKGTDFFVSYSMGVTSIMVTDGKVDVFNPAIPGQVVRVTEGNGTFIAGDKPPSLPRPATDVEFIRHTRDTDIFGYEGPGGTPPTDTGGTVETTVEIPSSESHPELLAPIITFAATPASITNQSTAVFTVTATDSATFTYTMDNWSVISPMTTSDTVTITGLPEGTHTITIVAANIVGNKSQPITYTWTTDYTPPVAGIASSPSTLTNSPSAAFGFTANEAASSYSYSLDGGATWVSTGSSLNLAGVSEGGHIIQVRATDLAGNTSVASSSYSWTTDYTAPTSLTLTGTPASLTNINTATIGATATDINGVTYSYTLDGAASTGNLTGLTEGVHIFIATATDGAGNTSTTSYSWLTDYTAPTVSITPLASSPELTGATAAVNISLGSSETAAYSYSLDNGATWVSTSASLNLSGVPEGANIIQVRATDLAGNTSVSTPLSFDLSRYSLTGNAIETTGALTFSLLTGEVAGISNQTWGGWNIDMDMIPTSIPLSFTLNAGGTSSDATTSNNGGYWIEIINGTSDGISVLSGTASFKYLSRDRLGKGTGAMTGNDVGNLSAGTYTETPLAWSGNIGYDQNDWGLYTIGATGIIGIGDSYGGLFGGITPSLSNPALITFMGPYNDFGVNSSPYIWTPVIYSGNGSWAYAPSYDGNEFWGYIGGTFQNGAIDGRVYSLYIDSLGNAGILKGSLAGAYYSSLSMLQADGTWTPIQIATGVLQSALADLTYSPAWSWSSLNTTISSGGYFTSGGLPLDTSISVVGAEGRKDSIAGEKWGIWQTILGGTYTTYGSPDGWNLSTTVIDSAGNIAGTQTDGAQWSNGVLAGQTYGYGADITTTPNTWISVGETIGTFDAAVYTWQAVQTGAWLDTNKFLAMVAANDTATLTALNIPFAEVGKTTLSGSGAMGGAPINVNMNNVTFFAYQTGAAPKLWATGDVNGTYGCSACGATTVGLTGSDGLGANFNVQTFDTTGQKWIATVDGGGTYTGTGTMNGTNVQMTGAAAGTNTGIGPGTFSGTGAGVAK